MKGIIPRISGEIREDRKRMPLTVLILVPELHIKKNNEKKKKEEKILASKNKEKAIKIYS